MKRTIILLTLTWLCAGHVHAQKQKVKHKTKPSAWSAIKTKNLLANSAWSTTSTEQQMITEFNGELQTQNQQVTISCHKGKFDFDIAGDKKNSFSVKTDYDKTELDVVYFVPKPKAYSRITIHKQDKLIVVEYADNTHTSYLYSGKLIQNPKD
ncbi:hypothetical protein QQ020_35915 [Fulvivirgaceae bacterium BMA12]|uniref:Lipocalin-like domain-containing protein n=1 Tax=Agaribacillus aureus TaxID=3051825 RepID=A0ABT8LI86_9BACT|nr:hypothetical protein [Fulvivirgaceae bacterium BMA12]